MKRFYLIFLFAMFSEILFSQGYYQWSDEQIITDTISSYSNPMVIPMGTDAWMFYQKNEDKSSILKMNLTTLSEDAVVLASDSVNYTCPYFVSRYNPNYLGYIFYVSDVEGYQNLYASKYYDNDSLGQRLRISKNPMNQNVIDYSIVEDGYISFSIDSLVYGARLMFYMDSVYTEDETLLDSSSSHIQIKYYQATWQKHEGGNSHIYSSYYRYNADSAKFYWTMPAYIDSIGNSEWLAKSNSVFGWGENEMIWVKDNNIRVLSGDYNYHEISDINTFSKPDVRQISMVNWDIAVKSDYYFPHYTAYTIDTGNQSEIFCSQGEYSWDDSAQISNNAYPDSYPRLFFGESYDGWGSEAYFVYCIWQSDINGHIALSSSKAVAFIGSSIDENQGFEDYLEVFPSPVHHKLNVKVNSHSGEAHLRILDMQGKTVFYQTDIQTNNNWNTFVWTPDAGLKNGSYIISLELGAKKYSRKILLVR